MKKILYLTLFLLVYVFVGCSDDDLEVNPSSSLGSAIAVKNTEDLRAAVNTMYNKMTSSTYYGGKYLTAADMLGDDALNPYFSSNWLGGYFDYSWTKIATQTAFYRAAYGGIAHANDVFPKAEALKDSPEKKALIAELRALRAIMHFDVAKLYGPIPVNLGKGGIKEDALCVPIMNETKDPKDYEGMLRRSTKEVYQFIVSELEAALTDLPQGKIKGTLGYDGAKAALARIYLYMGEYAKAYNYANELISNSNYSLIAKDNYVESWKEEYTSESIFELSVTTDDNEGINSIGYYVLADGTKGYKEITASKHFEKLMKLDPTDVRFDLFVYYEDNKGAGYLPTKKYPGRGGDNFVNNLKIYRLSEMYLIAAEAKFHTDKNAAAAILNKLRKERTSTDPEKYKGENIKIEDILYERRLELFAEGHRAWDLWRNQKSVVRWENPQEKDEYLYRDDESDGVIEFDSYKNILPISEGQLLLLPEEYRETQQNPGY